MAFKVMLAYFRPSGKYLASVETILAFDAITEIWEEVHEMRKLGRLPGLRPNAGRDLFIIVDVPDHPQRVPHLVRPPSFDEDDVTPSRVSTGVSTPTVRLPLDEMSRTTTRDVIKIDSETSEEVTPVDVPIPKPPPE